MIILGICTFFIDNVYFSRTIFKGRKTSGRSVFNEIANEIEVNQPSIFTHVRYLLFLPNFLCLSTFIAIIYYILTCIQFYFPKFLQQEYGVSESEILVIFSVICILGPICGLVFGSIVISHFGGYSCKDSYKPITVMAIMCFFVILPFPFVNSKYGVVGEMFMLLFFGSAILPSFVGITLEKVPNWLTSSANTFVVLQTCLMGYMASTISYGALTDYFGVANQRQTFTCMLFTSSLGMVLVPYGLYAKNSEESV